MDVLRCRPVAEKYDDSKFLPPGAKLNFAEGDKRKTSAAGNVEELPVWVAKWVLGDATKHIGDLFLVSKLDYIAKEFFTTVGAMLSKVIMPPLPIPTSAKDIFSMLDLLKCFISSDGIALVTSNFKLLADSTEVTAENIMNDGVGAPKMKPLDLSLSAYDPGAWHVDIFMGDIKPLETDAMIALAQCYGHVADIICFVVCFTLQVLEHKHGAALLTTTTGAPIGSMRDCVIAVFSWLTSSLGLTWTHIKDIASSMTAEGYSLRWRIDQLDILTGSIGTSWLLAAKERCIESLSSALTSMCKDLQERTPSWGHIVTGSRYNGALAKKQLLGPPLSMLADLIDATSGLIADICDLSAQLGHARSENQHIAEAEGILEHAQTCMIVKRRRQRARELQQHLRGRAHGHRFARREGYAGGPQAEAPRPLEVRRGDMMRVERRRLVALRF